MLGLYLENKVPVAGALVSNTRRPRLRAADRVTRLIDTLTDSRDVVVERQHADLICHIPVGGYGVTEFRMSDERQQLLIASGRDGHGSLPGYADLNRAGDSEGSGEGRLTRSRRGRRKVSRWGGSCRGTAATGDTAPLGCRCLRAVDAGRK